MKKIIKILLTIIIFSLSAVIMLACLGGGDENLIKVNIEIEDGFSIEKTSSQLIIKDAAESIGIIELSGDTRFNSDGTITVVSGKKIIPSILLSCNYDIKDVRISANGKSPISYTGSESDWHTANNYSNLNLSDKYIYMRYIFNEITTDKSDTVINLAVSGITPLTIADKTFTLLKVKTENVFSTNIVIDGTEIPYGISEENEVESGTFKYFSSYTFDKDGTFEYVVKSKNENDLTTEKVDGTWTKAENGYKLDYLDENGDVFNSYEVTLYWAPEELNLSLNVYLMHQTSEYTQYYKLA